MDSPMSFQLVELQFFFFFFVYLTIYIVHHVKGASAHCVGRIVQVKINLIKVCWLKTG